MASLTLRVTGIAVAQSRAFGELASELSAMIQQYTNVRLKRFFRGNPKRVWAPSARRTAGEISGHRLKLRDEGNQIGELRDGSGQRPNRRWMRDDNALLLS
jgi:hypothetical protein